MMLENKVVELLGTKFPLVQAGMIWCSGWELASAVSNAGGLGVIGSGSMYPEVLKAQIQKCKQHTTKPFGVNVPLLYPTIKEHMAIIQEEHVPVVITSAGSPKLWTDELKSAGAKVIHVVSSAKFAAKAEQAGVDAIVAEGFEAGGHNGREETTTMVLIPLVAQAVSIPVIAAGGIADGRSMLAAMCLGADGVQIGSRFVCSTESSAHVNFKNRIIAASEGDTQLTLKELTPVRLLKNAFYEKVSMCYQRGATIEELKEILGRARAKKGMFEGDMEEGELEIGQVSGNIKDVQNAAQIVAGIMSEFSRVKANLSRGPDFLTQ